MGKLIEKREWLHKTLAQRAKEGMPRWTEADCMEESRKIFNRGLSRKYVKLALQRTFPGEPTGRDGRRHQADRAAAAANGLGQGHPVAPPKDFVEEANAEFHKVIERVRQVNGEDVARRERIKEKFLRVRVRNDHDVQTAIVLLIEAILDAEAKLRS